MRKIIVLCASILLCGCFTAVAVAQEPGKTGRGYKLVVTNDVHGYAVEDAGHRRIGYARLMGYVNSLRADGWEVFLLDAGDVFSGSVYAQFDDGRSIAELLSRMGYSVMNPGNHAFDFNLPENDSLYYSNVLLEMARRGNPSFRAVTCVNLSRNGIELPNVQNSPVVLVDDSENADQPVRIVIAGVLTPYVATLSNREGLDGYDFTLFLKDNKPDHISTREAVLDKLRQALSPYDGPHDAVVVLSHVGYDGGDDYKDNQISGPDIARVRNVDAVVDSHTHNATQPEMIDGSVIDNGGRYLEHFTEITIVPQKGGKPEIAMALRAYEDVLGVDPDPGIAELLAEISDRLGLGEVLFDLDEPELLSDKLINDQSTPLGRFICRTMAEAAGADFAMYNSGGIRNGLVAGQVTVGAFYNVTPFLNDLMVYEMTGKQLFDMLSELPPRGVNGFMQMWGMAVHLWEDDRPHGGSKLRAMFVLDANGILLDENTTYTVALNSYMVEGGDNFIFDPSIEGRNLGDCTTAMIDTIRGTSGLELDDLRENHTIFFHEDNSEVR
jgi:5''-nucleotidase/2'',3''-cyclic phosphodiesterase and related esterases